MEDESVTEIIIPEEIDSLPVKSIRNYAFAWCSSLKEIIIPESVESIGKSAFARTPWLEEKIKENSYVIVNNILIEAQSLDISYYKSGDLNSDDIIDASDASNILLLYSLASTGIDTNLSDEQLDIVDVNYDGLIDGKDASVILSYYAYVSTLSETEDVPDIAKYIYMSGEPASSLTAPEGLYPGKEGTVEYIVNTANLTPHDSYPLYNIKGDNDHDGKPYHSRDFYISAEDKRIMNKFAQEHFTENMTNYQRLEYTWLWLHENVNYAYVTSEKNLYAEIAGDSWVKACFEKKLGQCLQYNGALAEMMAYMGYDVYMLEMWMRDDFTVQHFRMEANIDGTPYSFEVGNLGDQGSYWKWFFRPMEKSSIEGLVE